MDGGKLGHPDVLKDAQDAELALLIDQGIVGEDREVDLHRHETRIELITSSLRIALTTSIPSVTCPNTVCLRSRCDWGE